MNQYELFHSDADYAPVDDYCDRPSPADEINESLGYDADVTDSSQYCKHGTFIGSWWGPDYLCSWCEMGEDPPPYVPPRFKVTYRNADGPWWISLGGYDRQVDEGADRDKLWGPDSLAGVIRQERFANHNGRISILLWEYRPSRCDWIMVDRI